MIMVSMWEFEDNVYLSVISALHYGNSWLFF